MTMFPKPNIARLEGPALTALRWQRWTLDKGICKKCGISTYWEPRFDGDPQAYDMAHKISRGAGGPDTLENTETHCHSCHMRSHNCGGKPLPRKDFQLF
jgi:hypothetical protein